VREESDGAAAAREAAAHEHKNWVRLTNDCNNHCIFCLDTHAHDGTVRPAMDVKVQIIEGRKKGATRLILSGGEPTIHPAFLELVKLGKRAGYRRIQTVTNGRMFAYPEFLARAAEAGLGEITFSLHGHTPKLHDALVGVPGAFEQEVAGLRSALSSGRFIVNVDVVINGVNVKHLPDMLETFMEWGVRELDLLQVIPFGNAWGPARHKLFYELAGHEEALARAFAMTRRPDVHVWLNRFPPAWAEGFEELIQDPHKLHDEVRGRGEEFDRYLALGQKLDCREPERCRHCYLQPLCDDLDASLATNTARTVDVVRLVEPAPLPSTLSTTRVVHVVASSVASATELAAQLPDAELWLELPSYAELSGPELGARPVRRLFVDTPADLERVSRWSGDFEIVARVTRDSAPLLPKLGSELGRRLVVEQPRYPRVTEQRARDADLRALCAGLPSPVRTRGIPACLGGRVPEPPTRTLDAGTLGADGRTDMARFTERFVDARFTTKSRRCRECRHDTACEGVHLNFVRTHGYGVLEPVREDGSAG
jgi:pyruvate-formate lyase-activating enzyme